MAKQISKGSRFPLMFLIVLVYLAIFAGCRREPPCKTAENQILIGSQMGQMICKTEMQMQNYASKSVLLENLETEESDPATEESEVSDLERADSGKRTLLYLLQTAKEPLGHTMYVWGGGWNEEDTAAGKEARSIGESPRWQEFFQQQDASYNYKNTKYQIHDGLDCSGYVGWIVYNVFEDVDGEEGYVEKAGSMAEHFADRGWGTYTPAGQVADWKPGDIMSMKGHVWISLGMCEDGSVVLLHASPPGVILSGTRHTDGSKSRAVELAEYYMSTYYPDWYAKYPDCSRKANYLSKSGQMRWNRDTLADEEHMLEMTAEEVLDMLF